VKFRFVRQQLKEFPTESAFIPPFFITESDDKFAPSSDKVANIDADLSVSSNHKITVMDALCDAQILRAILN
jgi:hypothetical protein